MKLTQVTHAHKLIPFMNLIACKRSDSREWFFFALFVTKDDVLVDEIEQFVKFHFKSTEAHTCKAQDAVFIFAPHSDLTKLSNLERIACKEFNPSSIRILFTSNKNAGLDKISTAIAPYASDTLSKLAHKRMSRKGNIIMVLDDDLMIIKHMEKLLDGSGRVIGVNTTSDWQTTYCEHAPNIIFLDIHLGEEKGNTLLRTLRQSVDPQAHVVMISADTSETIVADIKKGGANGFVVKPLEKARVIEHLHRAPTFVRGNLFT